MTWISKSEESKIDHLRNNILTLVRGDKTFEITSNKIYCYGQVDFNNDDDLDIIDNFKFLNHLTDRGVAIYSRYDYNTHTCKSTSKRLMWKECFSPAELATYAHGMLGKPERIVLFDI